MPQEKEKCPLCDVSEDTIEKLKKAGEEKKDKGDNYSK